MTQSDSEDADHSHRTLHLLEHNPAFAGNSIRTSKYTWYNFLPRNLLVQFSKAANVFYLFIACLQVIPLLSITGGRPVILLPLTQVVVTSMVKDVFEDSKRHKSDRLENRREVLACRGSAIMKIRWRDVRVGDILRVQQGEYLPADLVVLASSETQGVCYVETKNLDGESNLKAKYVPKALLATVDEENIH